VYKITIIFQYNDVSNRNMIPLDQLIFLTHTIHKSAKYTLNFMM